MKPPRLINSTPNPECPACNLQHRHTDEDWEKYHPFKDEGYNKEQGWTEKLKESF